MTLVIDQPHEKIEISEGVLSGIDAKSIEEYLVDSVFHEQMASQPEGPAKDLILRLDDILDSSNPEQKLRDETSKLSHEEKVKYAHFLTIKNSCQAASPILAKENVPDSPDQNAYNIDHMVGMMKNSGIPAQQAAVIVGIVVRSPTGTPHPTQHLSEEGKELFRALINVSNMDVSERVQATQDIVKKMLDTKMTRDGRMNVREETMSDREQAKIHRQGLRKVYHQLQDAFEKHYSGGATPDLLSGDIGMSLAYHTWFGGGDSDGKANADRKALLEGIVGYTVDAVEEHLQDVQHAMEADPSLNSKLSHAMESLTTLRDRLRILENKLLSDDKALVFDDLKNEFEDAYKGLTIDGVTSLRTEQDFYLALTPHLHTVIKQETQNEDARLALKETLFLLRQHKDTLSTAKIEVRANGLKDNEIMDKLFSDHKFQDVIQLSKHDRVLILRKGGFTKLEHADQYRFMKIAEDAKHDNKGLILDHYYRIFQPVFDGNGHPDQLLERARRLEIKKIAPYKFGMDIVAEAVFLSPEYQRFLGEVAVGVVDMQHTMLNEEYETLKEAPESAKSFSEKGGVLSVFNRQNARKRLQSVLDAFGKMFPCSDSGKLLGIGARYIIYQNILKLMSDAVENIKTYQIKWGNGLRTQRGGGNGHYPGRYKAQGIQMALGDRVLDLDNEDDIKILRNVAFSSNTRQGREPDYTFGNPDQICADHINSIGEMIGRVLELTGKVPKGTYIAQPVAFSKAMKKSIKHMAHEIMMKGYKNLRASETLGQRISDGFAKLVSNMRIAGASNLAARPDSKVIATPLAPKAKTEGKPLFDLRAIGTTVAIGHSRTNHDGWYTLGQSMQFLHQQFLDKKISSSDLKDFITDPFWEDNIKVGLRTLSDADIGHALRKLEMDGWSHDRVLQVAKTIELHVSEDENGEEKVEFSYDDEGGTITPQQAYTAKLYHDQALFATYTEKFAQLRRSGKNEFPDTVEEVGQATKLHLDTRQDGDETANRFSLGYHTNQLFPFVDQDKNGNRLSVLPSRVLADIGEECFDDLTASQRIAITAAERSATALHSDVFLDLDTFGAKPSPDLIATMLGYVRSLGYVAEPTIDPTDDPSAEVV